MPRQVLSVKAAEKALSPNRLARYRKPDSGEGDVEAIARYLWDVTLQSALVPALHIAEVTIRNAVHIVPRPERTRAALRSRFDGVRSFRNRVIHHEPIWDQDPGTDYAYLLQTLRYLNPGVERALADLSRFPSVLRDGPEAYLPDAERLLTGRGLGET